MLAYAMTTPRAMPTLIVFRDGALDSVVDLTGPVCEVGADAGADVRLDGLGPDSGRLTFARQGSFHEVRAGIGLTIRVNGVGTRRRLLRSGDAVECGPYTIYL